MRWTLLLSFALIAVSCYSRIALARRGWPGVFMGVEWRTEGSRLDSLFSGGMVCMFLCQPFGGGLQTNRVLLFDSVHPAPFRDLARTFPSRVYRPRITTSPRLFRVHFYEHPRTNKSPDLLIAINHVSTRRFVENGSYLHIERKLSFFLNLIII